MFPVEKLSAAVAGFLIGGESLAYRLDLIWKLIDGSMALNSLLCADVPLRNCSINQYRRRLMLAVPGSVCSKGELCKKRWGLPQFWPAPSKKPGPTLP